MKYNLMSVKIRDLFDEYQNDEEEGVFGYHGKLNVRPKFQREFCYKPEQQNAVIESILNKRPLNLFYWSKNEDDTYELMDGQQRTISIYNYIDGQFALNFQYFFNLDESQKNQILDYELMVYVCEGTDKEKLDWFQTINIAGEKLTDQELLNAVYSGTWTTEAKKYFSKTNCVAYNLASDYLNGSPIRQDYLHTVLTWISDVEGIALEDYMAKHQHDTSANDLQMYFQNVINWVKTVFPKYRKYMKGLPWGIYYNRHKDEHYNSDELEARITELEMDDDVTNNKGIYAYLLTGEEKHLNIRAFSEKDKLRKYNEQGGVCAKCGNRFAYTDMDGDHILPWSKGGKTEYDNLQMLCISCNRSNL